MGACSSPVASSRGELGRCRKGRTCATALQATATPSWPCSSGRAMRCGLSALARSQCNRSLRSHALVPSSAAAATRCGLATSERRSTSPTASRAVEPFRCRSSSGVHRPLGNAPLKGHCCRSRNTAPCSVSPVWRCRSGGGLSAAPCHKPSTSAGSRPAPSAPRPPRRPTSKYARRPRLPRQRRSSCRHRARRPSAAAGEGR